MSTHLNSRCQRMYISLLAANIVFLLALTDAYAQADNRNRLDREVFTIVEKSPEFPGGDRAMWAYLKQHTEYPSEAVENKVKGRVYISFIVQKDGHLTDFQLVEGLGHGCDEEAMRVAKAMPPWKPGSQSGQLLRVKYTLPVLFGIDYPGSKGR